MEIFKTWSEFKTIVADKNLVVNFNEGDVFYYIFAPEGSATWFTEIEKTSPESADQLDFENNFKNNSNKAHKSLLNQITPPGTTRVVNVTQELVSGFFDTTYLIPAGKILTIQRVFCASSLSLGNIVSSKLELYDDLNGDGTVLSLATTLYTIGGLADIFINEQFVGNGARRIRSRLTTLDVGAREIYAKWEGYLA
jgi:hypothetical protein